MRKNINMKLYNTFIKTSFDNVYIHSLPFHGHRGRKWNTALASVFAYPGLFNTHAEFKLGWPDYNVLNESLIIKYIQRIEQLNIIGK